MSRLLNKSSSDFQKARTFFQPKAEPKEVRVYVEDTDDVAFWFGILSPYAKSANIKFKITAYSKDTEIGENDATTGKEKLKKLFPNTGEYLIICLDSDYDYLLPDNSEIAKEINRNPYIFQTYSYAMENLKCYAESLNNLCINATQNSLDDTIDLPDFLETYSQIIYPLLIWNLYFESIQNPSLFSRNNFKNIVTIGNMSPDNYQTLLDSLEKSITEKLKIFEINVDIFDFSKQFPEINDKNAYLFINGHALYSTILNLLKEICKKLESKHIAQIKKLAQTPKERTEKIKHYRENVTSPIKTLLKNNEKFIDCFLFEKIKTDIENYLTLFKQAQGLKHV